MLRLIGTTTYEIKSVFEGETNIKIHERKQYFKSDKKILEPDNISWFTEDTDKEEVYLRVDKDEWCGFEWYVCYEKEDTFSDSKLIQLYNKYSSWSAFNGYDKRLEEEYKISMDRQNKLERICKTK